MLSRETMCSAITTAAPAAAPAAPVAPDSGENDADGEDPESETGTDDRNVD